MSNVMRMAYQVVTLSSDVVIAAYNILTDEGVPRLSAATLSLSAERSGVDPERFARELVRRRRARRVLTGSGQP